jgi:hypothetical protein
VESLRLAAALLSASLAAAATLATAAALLSAAHPAAATLTTTAALLSASLLSAAHPAAAALLATLTTAAALLTAALAALAGLGGQRTVVLWIRHSSPPRNFETRTQGAIHVPRRRRAPRAP